MKMGKKVNLRGVVIAWDYLLEKKPANPKNKGEKDAFKVDVLLPMDDMKQVNALEDAAYEVMTEALKSEAAAEKWLKRESGFEGNYSKDCAIKDGNERDDADERFKDMLIIACKSYKMPKVQTDLAETTIDGETDAKTGDDLEGKLPYGGAKCNVSIELWGQNNDFGKGLRANILGVRFVEDGPAFGGGSKESASDEDLGSDDEDTDRSSRRRSKDKDESRSSRRSSRRGSDEDEDDSRESRRSRRNRDEDEEEEDSRSSRRRSRDEDDDDEDEDRGSRRRSRR